MPFRCRTARRWNRQALERLTETSEKTKVELSGTVETTVSLPFVTADANGPKHLEMKITRANFELPHGPFARL